jgi:aerobic-type carbon monoxide dehydrogenase small subunit (CoxS/CutS family)
VTIAKRPLSLTVNGRAVGPIDVPETMMMLDFLHEHLNLTGTRMGCGQGICHACTAMLEERDGGWREIRTCITGAHFFGGKRVRTIEGHAGRDKQGTVVALTPIQQAFIEHFAFQCGYCTPGFVTGATVLLEQLKRRPIRRSEVESVIETALAPHICRCTGYVRYYEAVRTVILATPGLVVG